MVLQEILFWVFAGALLISAVLVILSPDAVASAVFLIMALFFMSGLYMLLQAFFLAVIQILVYAGAVMVLYLFVLMLLDPKQPRRWWFKNPAVVGAPLLAAAFLVSMSAVLQVAPCRTAPTAEEIRSISLAEIVRPLFTTYLLPLEVTAFILLVAAVGVVILGRKEEP